MASDRIISSHPLTTCNARAAPHSADELAETAAGLLATEGTAGLARFDDFPGPLYATDRDGHLLYYNDACVAFAGRTPRVGIDRWCVSWKLHTDDGAALAHDECPMAIAIRERCPVRGTTAWAERPDGGRTRFEPFPTPAFDEDGRVVGAVNLVVPSDGRLHRDLLATAQRCRTLVKWIGDRQANDSLTRMAVECDEHALILAPSGPAMARN